MNFDLFKLHDETLDISNQGWICFKGPNLPNVVNDAKNELMKKYNLKFTSELVKLVANKLNCKTWTPEQILYGHKKWVPIPILKALIEMTNNPAEYKNAILTDTNLIKCNSATSLPIKAVKEPNETLCKIAGAHAGDGNIYNSLGIEIRNISYSGSILKIFKKYNKNAKIFRTKNRVRIKVKNISPQKIIKELTPFLKRRDITFWLTHGINVTEMYEYSIRAFALWIKDVFGIDARVTHHGTKNAWRVDFDNKIIARYLIKFFGFPAGVKTYTVKEPEIIKNSCIEFRKAFLIGLMTFEGYTPYHGKAIGLSSKSRELVENVYDIITKIGIPVKKVKKDTYSRYICISRVLDKINLKKAQDLFEPNTEKWFRIQRNLSI